MRSRDGMFGCVARFFKGVVLLEAGAVVIFFGALLNHPELKENAAQALRELKASGYEIPDVYHPVKVRPIESSDSFRSSRASMWGPGSIYLRESPQGNLGPEVYLRHELMHEARYRTCKSTDDWEQEASAMDFSGELSGMAQTHPPSEDELEYLRKRIHSYDSFDDNSYKTVAGLMAIYGWPKEPCSVSEPIAKLLDAGNSWKHVEFSYILIHLASGRVLEAKGNLEGRYAPGSLLKIPYAAALKEASPEAIGAELAASDTAGLLKRRESFDPDRYRLLINPVKDTALSRKMSAEDLAGKNEKFWRQYLGERSPAGSFPLEGNLKELALTLRSSILYRPHYFSGLTSNGFVEGTTLYPELQWDKEILKKLHAMSKTGTVSDADGNPLIGHLMVAWPAPTPTYLAIFRSTGRNGASNMRRASEVLHGWERSYPVQGSKVRVRIMTLTPRSSWELVEECPTFEREGHDGWREKVSTCGNFGILSTAKGSRTERVVSGILKSSPDEQKVVLETDSETYADGVLASEAQELRREAQRALRAVIAWNGTHGSGRHEETSSLCDTTHCMVFKGNPSGPAQSKENQTDPNLTKALDKLAATKRLDWLLFSKGGDAKWTKFLDSAELRKLVDEPAILDIRRERARNGEVFVHLMYQENEEVAPCEAFRNKLKLPSCPEAIRFDESRGGFTFEGIGEGHGQGLSVERARVLSETGLTAAQILSDAYR